MEGLKEEEEEDLILPWLLLLILDMTRTSYLHHALCVYITDPTQPDVCLTLPDLNLINLTLVESLTLPVTIVINEVLPHLTCHDLTLPDLT